MAASLAELSNIYTPIRKSRPSGTVLRHASMPTSFVSSLYPANSDEGGANSRLQDPRSLSRNLRTAFMSDLPLAQSPIIQPRRDRNTRRSLTQKQERNPVATYHNLKDQAEIISSLESENLTLRDHQEEATTAGRQLSSRIQDLVTTNDSLDNQLKDSLRTVARLTKSDRAKGKVHQRNLRLKATLHQISLRGVGSSAQADANSEATLREALAIANDRIGELERAGEKLLVVLEKQPEQDMRGDGSKMAHESTDTELLRLEVALRNVLDDEFFEEQRENWAVFLDE